METKTSKVTKVTKMEKQDNYGNFSFVPEFENGDKGFYTTKESEQKKFVSGQQIEYCIEKKTGSTGKDYFKITLPKAEGSFNGSAFKGGAKAPANNASFCLAYSKDIYIAKLQTIGGNAVKDEEIFTLAEKMFTWMEGKK
jgi:hypothetical protein